MIAYTSVGRFLKMGTLWSVFGLIAVVAIQIFARFFLESAPSWTEEASRLFFIYAVSFAAGLGVKTNYYVYLDMLFNVLPAKARKILEILVPGITFLMFALMAVFSVKFIVLGLPEKSPSLGFPMAFAFVSMLLMSLSICYYAWEKLIKGLYNFRR